MSDNGRKYYRAEGRSLEIVLQFFAARKAAHEAAWAMMERYGAEDATVTHLGIVSIRLADGAEPNVGLTKRKDGMYVPRRGKPGAAVRAEWGTVPGIPNAEQLTRRLFPERRGPPGWWVAGPFRFAVRQAHAERVGETWVISLPEEAEETPPDAVAMRTSEYWALREAASEVGGGAP